MSALTAGEVVERIKKNLGIPWRDQTYRDTFKFGGPETPLGQLATLCQKKLGDKLLRVVGDPNATVRRLQLGVGYATPAINAPDVDVVISGEQQESDGMLDSPAYVLDATTLGIAKGWIMLGHNISE